MSVGKKYPRAFTVRAVDASVMDIPAALEYGPRTGPTSVHRCDPPALFVLNNLVGGLQRARNGRPREEESIVLRSEARVDVNVIASD